MMSPVYTTSKALPGTERLALTSDDRYEGAMKVSVGPVTAAKFDVTVPFHVAWQTYDYSPVSG